jgi:ATP-dependent DNA helicase DinG
MSWATAKEKFAEALPGFQVRDNQDRLAVTIETSFERGQHLFAQAGCGTGKSFAGLIPAIAHSHETHLPVILATATKALQDQYAGKDLPFLQGVLGDFKFAVLKGRSNYVCQAKVDELEVPSFKAEVKRVIDAEGFDGEIESVTLELTPQEKAGLSTTSDECPGKSECPFGDVCFSERAKTAAKSANIVVVNHAVLAADMAVKLAQRSIGVPDDKVTGLLPEFGGVVVDEAHEMAEFVTNALGGEITSGSYGRLATQIANLLTDRDVISKVNDASTDLFLVVERALARREDKRNKTVRVDDAILVALGPKIEKLITELAALKTKVAAAQIHGNDKAAQQKKRLVKRLDNAVNRLRALVLAGDDELVRWLELAEGKKGNTIKWAPLTVADFLRENLLEVAPTTFMSATLALGDDFSFLAGQLGVDEYGSFDAGTPFNFQEQARTFIPQLPAPAGWTVNQWRTGSIATMTELIKASNGRALLLFTSKTEMEEAHRAIAPIIKRMGHAALKQGDAPNKVLKETFDKDEHSVLFALKSFMTGIDIQGDSLRLVVINKLPFPVPSDVIFKARTDALDKQYGQWHKKAGFNGLTVPTMALTLMQAYGRLIRTVDDRGVVAILDSRLYAPKGTKGNAKPYGAVIMNALEKAPVITELSEAVSYLESLEG